MATRSRIAPVIDVGRLRAAIAGPGADPRTWGFEGRIDDDPDAIRWDEKLGWLCDVTVTGGQLDGEGPITCRAMVPFAGNGFGGPFHPPRRDLNVVCVLPQADLNSTPVIVGYVFDDNSPVPTSFGDLAANEDNLQNTHAFSSDKDVVSKTSGAIKAVFDGNGALLFGNEVQITAQNIKFAAATKAFVRGEDMKQAIDNFATALVAAINGITPTSGGVAAATAIQTAATVLSSALQTSLSVKIKGE